VYQNALFPVKQRIKTILSWGIFFESSNLFHPFLLSKLKNRLKFAVPLIFLKQRLGRIKYWSKCFVSADSAKLSDLAMINFNVVPIWKIVKPLNADEAKAIENYIKNSYLTAESIEE
jgi:hypothetical protein